MTPEERQLLIQTSRLVEENNKILRKMRRGALFGRILHTLYWLVVIGLSVGAYIYVQPYVDQLKEAYGGIQQDVNAAKSVSSKFSNFFKGGQ